ncbi:MAG: hypothetical protein ACK4YP_09730 [Myxococcota bacterium]
MKRCSGCGGRVTNAVACPACGTGLPTLASGSSGAALAVGWALTLATAGGPWLYLEVGLGPYVLGWVAYVVMANLLTPSVDTNDLGWGGGLWDNPFSYSDDRNRFLYTLALVLWPGKLVWWTLRLTWRAIGRLGA